MSCRSFFACMALYLGVSLIASTCLADTINQAAIIDHLSTQQVNSALVTASPAFCRDVDRNITVRGFAHHQGAFGFRGFGVAGGSVDGEIDNYGCLVTISVPESITIDYDQPVIVTEIVLSELFARGNGDTVNETALI